MLCVYCVWWYNKEIKWLVLVVVEGSRRCKELFPHVHPFPCDFLVSNFSSPTYNSMLPQQHHLHPRSTICQPPVSYSIWYGCSIALQSCRAGQFISPHTLSKRSTAETRDLESSICFIHAGCQIASCPNPPTAMPRSSRNFFPADLILVSIMTRSPHVQYQVQISTSLQRSINNQSCYLPTQPYFVSKVLAD